MTKKEYSSKLKTEEISIDGEDYYIKAASTQVKREFKNKQSSSVKLGNSGKPIGFNDIGGLELFLVSKCLYDATTDKLVPEKTIAEWDGDMVDNIYKDIRSLSNLKDDSDVRDQLGTLLAHEQSPISIEDLRDWIYEFSENEDFQEVCEWIKPTEDEKAKNLQPNSAQS